jgi:hypothetical protein
VQSGSALIRSAVVSEIVAQHPASRYYPYALLLSDRGYMKTSLAAIGAAIQRHAASPVYPRLLEAGAIIAERQGRMASEKHPGEAVHYYEIARDYATRARETGSAATFRQATALRNGVNADMERLVAGPKKK